MLSLMRIAVGSSGRRQHGKDWSRVALALLLGGRRHVGGPPRGLSYPRLPHASMVCWSAMHTPRPCILTCRLLADGGIQAPCTAVGAPR